MNARPLAAISILLVVLVFCERADNARAESAVKRPNIVYIMADDHTSNAWGCYGSRLAEFMLHFKATHEAWPLEILTE